MVRMPQYESLRSISYGAGANVTAVRCGWLLGLGQGRLEVALALWHTRPVFISAGSAQAEFSGAEPAKDAGGGLAQRERKFAVRADVMMDRLVQVNCTLERKLRLPFGRDRQERVSCSPITGSSTTLLYFVPSLRTRGSDCVTAFDLDARGACCGVRRSSRPHCLRRQTNPR